MVNSSEDAIISKDLEGTILTWNPAAVHMFGYESDEIAGSSILCLIPPELHEEEQEIFRRLRAGERIERRETIRIRKTGERFPIHVTLTPIQDAAGVIVGAASINRDLSEQKQTDETRFRLAAIVDSADDAIVSKDLNGVVRTWNGGACRMFGYSASEMVGCPILRLIPENLLYEEEEILSRLRAGQRIEHYETTRKKKSGELFQVSVTISPIRDQNGRIIGASKIARDISDRKRIERLLIQSEKLAATGRMAAAIAHEINNPLESLMNLVYLARHNTPESSKAYEFLTTAEQELERVSHIARQTLGFYRDTGHPIDVHIHDLIDNVLTVYNAKLISTSIRVATDYGDLQKITVSKGEMLQVISNIIANAIDAMRDGGRLTITTRKLTSTSSEGVQISISDSGTGIPQENLARVFEPFFTTKGSLGTGVGLWVARQLVERRGGQISIASSTEPGNSGVTLTIYLPFALPAPDLPSIQSTQS